MQINLYKGSNISTVMGYVRQRKFNFIGTKRHREELVRHCNERSFDILNCLNRNRIYVERFNNYSDNLFNIERLGLGSSVKKFIIIINFEDQLPNILGRLSNANPENFLDIDMIDEKSKSLLGLDFTSMNIKLMDFIYKDSKFDDYLYNLEEDKENGVVCSLMKDIHRELVELKELTAYYFQQKGMVIRSFDYDKCILTSDRPIEDDRLNLITIDGFEYSAKVSCYPSGSIKEALEC